MDKNMLNDCDLLTYSTWATSTASLLRRFLNEL